MLVVFRCFRGLALMLLRARYARRCAAIVAASRRLRYLLFVTDFAADATPFR